MKHGLLSTWHGAIRESLRSTKQKQTHDSAHKGQTAKHMVTFVSTQQSYG